MGRFLMIDIGAGTMDILVYDSDSDEHFKAVAPSPVRHLAAHIERTQGNLLVTGVEMGGGPVTDALRRRVATAAVEMTPEAAATLHHDMDRVREWGIALADDARVKQIDHGPGFTRVTLGDVQHERIAQIMNGMGLTLAFDAVVLCAQDHGVAPKGMSHLDYRHNRFQEMLDRCPSPHTLLFRHDEVPGAFNRLAAMAGEARRHLSPEVYVMDSGMAAMVGASQDPRAIGKAPVIIMDVATSHTVAAVMEGETVAAFVEYHTRDITLPRLETLLRDLADGRLAHQRVLAEGGHGAYVRHAVGFQAIQAIIATGPKRRMLDGSRLPITWGAPWGDNMMTGTVGLLEALRRRKGLPPIQYI